jgi:hypothetical protein
MILLMTLTPTATRLRAWICGVACQGRSDQGTPRSTAETTRLEFSGPPSHKRLAFSIRAPETSSSYLQTHDSDSLNLVKRFAEEVHADLQPRGRRPSASATRARRSLSTWSVSGSCDNPCLSLRSTMILCCTIGPAASGEPEQPSRVRRNDRLSSCRKCFRGPHGEGSFPLP